MIATCAWCQDLAAKRAEAERDEARAEAEWAKERLVEAREECDRQRALVARLAEAAGLADVWDSDALVQGLERLRAAKP